jgi:hypothetical protein
MRQGSRDHGRFDVAGIERQNPNTIARTLG